MLKVRLYLQLYTQYVQCETVFSVILGMFKVRDCVFSYILSMFNVRLYFHNNNNNNNNKRSHKSVSLLLISPMV